MSDGLLIALVAAILGPGVVSGALTAAALDVWREKRAAQKKLLEEKEAARQKTEEAVAAQVKVTEAGQTAVDNAVRELGLERIEELVEFFNQTGPEIEALKQSQSERVIAFGEMQAKYAAIEAHANDLDTKFERLTTDYQRVSAENSRKDDLIAERDARIVQLTAERDAALAAVTAALAERDAALAAAMRASAERDAAFAAKAVAEVERDTARQHYETLRLELELRRERGGESAN